MSIIQQRRSDVYLNEIDLSQAVTGSSSSVAGLVVVSNQGSTEMQFFSNADQFKAEFGNPNARIGFDVYSALDFFKEGNEMWARRVVGAGATYSAVMLYQDADETKLAAPATPIEDPEFVDFPDQVPASTTPLAMFYARKGQGSYGDSIAISIDSANVKTPTGLTVSSENTGGTLIPGDYEYQIACITPEGVSLASTSVQVTIAGSGSSYSNVLTWDLDPAALGYKIYGRDDGDVYFLQDVGQGTNTFVDTGAILPDTDIEPITDPADAAPIVPQFTVNIYDTNRSRTNPVESFVCTLDPMTDDDGISTELEERINPYSQYIRVKSNATTLLNVPGITDVASVNMAGGDSGAAPTMYDIAGAWQAFENKNLYQVDLLINSGNASPTVQLPMNTLAATTRQDCVALLDVPSAKQKAQDAVNYRNLELNLNSSYSALFSPDVLEVDTYNGKEQYVPFSGWAAALCARTDRVANPSFSIAGLNRGLLDVLKTRHTYTDGEQNLMYRAQVNYTRTFIGQGTALWEQQTLQAKYSALSWLSVRRIVNVMKRALLQFGLYIIQQPNDDFTRREVVTSFSQYLETIKNARGISAYTVVCDASNNPDAYVNSGILRCTVLIIPVLPVHELQVDFVVSKEGVSFSETLKSLYPS